MVNKMLHAGVPCSIYGRLADGYFVWIHIGANMVDGLDSVCRLPENGLVVDVTYDRFLCPQLFNQGGLFIAVHKSPDAYIAFYQGPNDCLSCFARSACD